MEHLGERLQVFDGSDGEQDQHAEDGTRKISGDYLREVEEAGGAEDKRSVGTRTKEAQADQVGKVKGNGQGLKGRRRQEQ